MNTAARTPALLPRLLLLTCVVAAVATAAGAQEITSPGAARKALKHEFRDGTKHQKSVLKDTTKELIGGLEAIQSDAKSGEFTAREIAERTHDEFVACTALMKTLTAYVASEVSFGAGEILDEFQSNTAEGVPVAFVPGAKTDVDKGMAKFEKVVAKTSRKMERLARRHVKKLAKAGYDVTIHVDDTLPVAIAPNADAAFTALNFDTLIDVLVGVRRTDVGDAALVIGGISNPAKVAEVDVQINGVGGIEHVATTPITNDRWIVVFDGEEVFLPESNYRVIATHGTTRVGTTIGLR